jgi:hypothetical protein
MADNRELAINHKTTKAPSPLLARADEVIE